MLSQQSPHAGLSCHAAVLELLVDNGPLSRDAGGIVSNQRLAVINTGSTRFAAMYHCTVEYSMHVCHLFVMRGQVRNPLMPLLHNRMMAWLQCC